MTIKNCGKLNSGVAYGLLTNLDLSRETGLVVLFVPAADAGDASVSINTADFGLGLTMEQVDWMIAALRNAQLCASDAPMSCGCNYGACKGHGSGRDVLVMAKEPHPASPPLPWLTQPNAMSSDCFPGNHAFAVGRERCDCGEVPAPTVAGTK